MSAAPQIKEKHVYLLVICTVIFWGGALVGGRVLAQHGIAPFTIATLRFIITSLILIPYLYYKEGKKAKLQLVDLPLMLLLGATGIMGFNAFFFIGLHYTTAVNGALIIATNAIVTTITTLFLHEKVRIMQIVGILTSFCGVCIVLSRGALANLLALQFNRGDLLMVGAMLSWVIFTLAGRKAMQKYSPLATTTHACICGTIILLPMMCWELRTFQIRMIGPEDWLIILYLAVFASALGFIWWYRGTAVLGPSRIAVFLNGNPISALIITAILGQDIITSSQLLGMLFVIGGVYLGSRNAAVQLPTNSKQPVAGSSAPVSQ